MTKKSKKKTGAKPAEQPEWLTYEEMTRIILDSCRDF